MHGERTLIRFIPAAMGVLVLGSIALACLFLTHPLDLCGRVRGALSDGDWFTSFNEVRAMGEEARPGLAKLLASNGYEASWEDRERRAVVLSLGILGEEQDVPPLVELLLERPGSDVCWSLGVLGDARAVPALIGIMKRAPQLSYGGPPSHIPLRWEAARALARLGDERAIAPLCEMILSEGPEALFYAEALEQVASPQAIDALLEVSLQSQERSRRALMQALQGMLGRLGCYGYEPRWSDAGRIELLDAIRAWWSGHRELPVRKLRRRGMALAMEDVRTGSSWRLESALRYLASLTHRVPVEGPLAADFEKAYQGAKRFREEHPSPRSVYATCLGAALKDPDALALLERWCQNPPVFPGHRDQSEEATVARERNEVRWGHPNDFVLATRTLLRHEPRLKAPLLPTWRGLLEATDRPLDRALLELFLDFAERELLVPLAARVAERSTSTDWLLRWHQACERLFPETGETEDAPSFADWWSRHHSEIAELRRKLRASPVGG